MLIPSTTPKSNCFTHFFFVCRCAEGQGTSALQHPTVTLELGQPVELIPNPTPPQRKMVGVLVC